MYKVYIFYYTKIVVRTYIIYFIIFNFILSLVVLFIFFFNHIILKKLIK